MPVNFKNIIWDFDGVIIDSATIKYNAFRQIVSGNPEEVINQFMQYHQQNGGMSRFVKFRYLYEVLLHQPVTEEKIQELATRFSQLVTTELSNKKYLIQDAVNYIKQNYHHQRMHIASGSEQTELRFLNEQLGIASYFLTILGSPTPKPEIVHNIMQDNNYLPEETCLIGDAGNDYDAATENGITFFGYNNPQLKERGLGYIESFDEVKRHN